MSYTRLFTPGRIGSLELRNRIVFPALESSFAEPDGTAGERIIRYYEERARGGCGLIITGLTRIDDETGNTSPTQLSAADPRYIPGLRRLADSVHRHGCKLFLQLFHPGHQTHSRLNGGRLYSASAVPNAVFGETPEVLSKTQIQDIIRRFCLSAQIARDAGADGVEIHGAHGYLLNQFLSPHTNMRMDEYGVDLAGRLRFITEVILSVRHTVGPDYPISVRINGDEFTGGGIGKEDAVHIAEYLDHLPIDCLNISSGVFETAWTMAEPASYPEGWKQDLARDIRSRVTHPVIAVNTIRHPATAEKLLESGVCDFAAVGRGQLADPFWAEKARLEEDSAIRPCIGCLECLRMLLDLHPIACSVNPLAGQEYLWGDDHLLKNGQGHTVAVVGAGPAGIQSSLVLAKRGYRVVLFEKADRPGGSLRDAVLPPHKELLQEFLQTFLQELRRSGVELRTDQAGTAERCLAVGAEAVFLSCGGTPVIPDAEGIEMACSALDALHHKIRTEGQRFVIIGGGMTGLETAEFLSETNDVTVIEESREAGASLCAPARHVLFDRLEQNHVCILTETKLKKIHAGYVTVQKEDGCMEDIRADQVIIAAGIRPSAAVPEEFLNTFSQVIPLGDAQESGQLKDALRSGYLAGFSYNNAAAAR